MTGHNYVCVVGPVEVATHRFPTTCWWHCCKLHVLHLCSSQAEFQCFNLYKFFLQMSGEVSHTKKSRPRDVNESNYIVHFELILSDILTT